MSVAALLAGSSTDQTQICKSTLQMMSAAPEEYRTVRSVAEEYVEQLFIYQHEQAESSVLRPLNLNWRSFSSGNVPPDLLPQITADLYRHQLNCGALIIGADATGAHIYQIKNGIIDCFDGVGFAAIGSGSRHASSEFMFARYSPLQMPISRAMYLAYSAKKRAEASPGVGKKTYLTALWGTYFGLHHEGQPLFAELEHHYFWAHAQIGVINDQAYAKMDTSLREIRKSPDDSQAAMPTAEAPPNPDMPPTASTPPAASAPEPPESNSETKTSRRRRKSR